jgi:signal transduction histidine kinase
LAPDARNVIGDRGQLFGLIGILGTNARDAMPNGGTLSIGVENVEVDEAMASGIAEARPGSYTVMTVADTGIGLPPFVRERLFEPFITTKKPGEGTGLGLFTAMYVARAHGGFISFASEERKGTSFRVFLPSDPAASPRN